jgi:hypothetical protein
MKMNQEELRGRVKTCVDFLTRALDRNNLDDVNRRENKDDNNVLENIVSQMSMYLSEFNFYPSDFYGHCCQVAFFTSLSGQRWNLKNKERISFDLMFKSLIRHCQGSCAGTTTYAVLIVDNWDDDIAKFWEPNIQQLKNKGVIIEVRMMIGGRPSVYEL